MISPAALAAHLVGLLGADDAPGSGGVWRAGRRPVARLGLALDPSPAVVEWTRRERVDALFLHRPWKLDVDALPPEVMVLWSHLPFDERMTVGHNPYLAAALGMTGTAPFGERDGRPLGMIGGITHASAEDVLAAVRRVFGGMESFEGGARGTVWRIAAVGAMTDALVRAAHAAGADLYLTGQLRAPAARAVVETGIAVAAVGHRRSEQWGLRTLAGLIASGTGARTTVWEGDGDEEAGSGDAWG